MRFGGRAYELEDVERIARSGLPFAEISLLEGSGLMGKQGELKVLGQRWGLQYLVHAPNEGKPTDLKRLGGPFFQEILGILEACKELSAPLLTVHLWMDGRFIPDRVMEGKREILWAMVREGARRGVQVCLENLSERPQDLQPVLEGCPELGLTVDMGHGELLSPVNRALEFLKLWPGRVLHVHAHDNKGGSHVKDDLHLPIGEGVVDFPAILGALVRAGYQGTITLEVPLDHLDTSVRRLRQILEPLLGRDPKEGETHE